MDEIMKKITMGIWGDSFAAFRVNQTSNTIHWFDVLQKYYTIDNWAVCASSIDYSYTRFMENHHKYEKNIFVVTHPGRIWLKNALPPSSPYYQYTHLNGLILAEINYNLIKKTMPNNMLAVNTFEAAINYFKYIQNDALDIHSALNMIKEIKNVRPDTLMIACFESQNNIISKVLGHENSLNDIALMENQSLGITEKYFTKFEDGRNCHITEENNIILGKKMLEWLETSKVVLDLNDFYRPTNLEEFTKKYCFRGT